MKILLIIFSLIAYQHQLLAFEPETYDLLKVYQLGLEYDPILKSSQSAYKGSLEFKAQARGALLPRVDLGALTTRSDSGNINPPVQNFNVNQLTLNASQPIYHHDLWLELKNADLKTQQAQASLDAAEQDLMLRVSERYFGVLEAKDALYFAQMQRTAFAKHLEQTQQRFEVGLIAITDVHEAKARHDSAVARELAAENDLANQLEILREIVGLPLIHLQGLKEELPLAAPHPESEEKWVDLTVRQNLQLAAARLGVDLAKRDILRQRAEHFPKIDLIASLRQGSSQLSPNSYPFSTATLTASMPLFAGGTISSKTMQAKANFEQIQHNYDHSLRATVSQTRQAYRGLLTQISSVKALAQAVVSNQSALAATEAAYEVGTRTIVDVLDSQSNLISAESDHAKARYQYILNTLRLKLSAGTLTPEDLKQINGWLN